MAQNNCSRVGAALTAIRNAGINVLRVLFGSLYLVRGNSMSPTLRDGDLIHVRRVSGKSASYARGSIVVAEIPPPSGDKRLLTNVKRVVGLPGELVRIGNDGAVSIEGTSLAEPYLDGSARAAPGRGLLWVCDDDEYFLMGDNRADSWDSRRFGPVPASNIMGSMWLRIPTRRLLGRKSAHRAGRTD